MRKEDVKKGSIYELDGVVPLKEALPLGIQHVLAMFLGNISPLLIIAGMLGLSPDLKSALIQNAMFIAGAVTLVQLYPVWKVGAKLPIVMGTSSGFIGTAKAMGALYGYGALMGASLIGGLFEMVLGFFIKPLRKLFPPVVTSLVIISIGLSLLPVGINYFGGGSGAADFGDPNTIAKIYPAIIPIKIEALFTKPLICFAIIITKITNVPTNKCLGSPKSKHYSQNL
jgi:xanthine/uracil permease